VEEWRIIERVYKGCFIIVTWFYIYDGKIVRVDYLVRENQVKF